MRRGVPVPEGWLLDFLRAMEEARNEMPLPMHALAGAVVLGHVIGLRAWTTLAAGVKVYPNLNGMLVSPAGECRRGEGSKVAVSIAKRAGLTVFEGRITTEALLLKLKQQHDVLMYIEEMSAQFTKQDFMVPLVPALTKLLLHGDGSYAYETRGGGEIKVENPNLSALVTTAPSWFEHSLPEDAASGGFLSRFIVCYRRKRDVRHVELGVTSSMDAELTRLAQQVAKLGRAVTGHVQATPEAQEWMRSWYESNEQRVGEAADAVRPMLARRPANVLRMAIVLMASRGEKALTPELLEAALRTVEWIESDTIKLYEELSSARTWLGKIEHAVLALLQARGGRVHSSVIVRQAHTLGKRGSARDVHDALNTLMECGIVRQDGLYWVLTEEGQDDGQPT